MRKDQVSIAIRENLGSRIRLLREAQGVSQHQFAIMIGVDHSYLLGVEKGRRNVSIDNPLKIAQGLGIPPSDPFREVDTFTYAQLP